MYRSLQGWLIECSTVGLIFALCSHIVSADLDQRSEATSASRLEDAVLPLTKRQREILDYLNEFIQQHGYAPSLEEIGRRFNLSSLATVHKHLTTSRKRASSAAPGTAAARSSWCRPASAGARSSCRCSASWPPARRSRRSPATKRSPCPKTLAGKRDSYVLRVKGDSMIDEQIRDGDFVIVEDRKSADNGEMVIALVGGLDVTLKKFYRENGRVRLQPANPAMQPIMVDPDQVQVQGVVVGVMRKY